MNYANLSPEAIKIISEAEQQIKRQTGVNVALVAFANAEHQ